MTLDEAVGDFGSRLEPRIRWDRTRRPRRPLTRGVRAPSVPKRPRLRRLVLRMLANHPERLSADLSYMILQGTGKDGFIPGVACLPAGPPGPRALRLRC